MGIPKSHAAQERHIVEETLVDVYAFLRASTPFVRDADFQRDVDYLRRRIKEEGIQFLTVQLSRLGDWFDQRLWGAEVQRVEGFKPYDGLNPCFLRPVWLWLDWLREHAESATAAHGVRLIRTLLHGFKKYETGWTDEQALQKINAFKQIESEMLDDVYPSSALYYAQLVMEKLLSSYEPTCSLPNHGPGAVAGGERFESKWEFSHIYESVHAEWPAWDWYFPIRSSDPVTSRSRNVQLAANAARYRQMTRLKAPQARLLLVPKDSRGPRVISCEPKELMYLQQGVAKDLMRFIESHAMTKGHVNFADQGINAELALRASKTREYCTIDLSDASDRVSVALVNYLCPPRVSRKWLALRSHSTLIAHTGEVVHMKKFAPMGSALCFPVESLVFWAICVGTIWSRTKNYALALESVYVYGDDIIIAETCPIRDVIYELESAGLKVNRSKSFMGEHPFRESCGIDAWLGYNVTPLRVKKNPPLRPNQGERVIAWVKYAENSQYISPARSRAQLSVVESVVGPIPRTRTTQSFLSLVTELDVWDLSKFRSVKFDSSRNLCTVKARTYRLKSRYTTLDGYDRLQRNLVSRFIDLDPRLVVEGLSTQMVISRHFYRF